MKTGLILFLTSFLFAASLSSPGDATECAKMEKQRPWDMGREVAIECDQVMRGASSAISQGNLPDIKRLLQANISEAEVILGQPFHCYEYGGENICFFLQDSPITIQYNKDSGRPTKILFNLIGIESPEEIPRVLGLGPTSPALDGPVGPYWNNLNGVKQLESHNPDFKYEGHFIYPIILHIDESPISSEWKRNVETIAD